MFREIDSFPFYMLYGIVRLCNSEADLIEPVIMQHILELRLRRTLRYTSSSEENRIKTTLPTHK